MPYEIRAADLAADRTDIIRLWGGGLREADAARYQWIYENNPQGAVGCWVVTDAPHSVIGVAAVFPQTLRDGARTWRAGVAGDFVVDKEHRAMGPALMLQKRFAGACAAGHAFDVVYGFANRAARAVQLRAGFVELGCATDLRKIIRSADALTRRFGVIGTLVAPFVDAGMATAELRGRGLSANYKCSESPVFDARFDELWARAAPGLPLTGERSSRYLNWRFREHPHIRYQTLIAERRDSAQIAGYLVWYVRDDEFIVADVLTDDSSGALVALAAGALERARTLGARSVRLRYFGADERFTSLQALGFRHSDSGRHVVVSIASTAPRDLFLDRKNWYLTEGDADP